MLATRLLCLVAVVGRCLAALDLALIITQTPECARTCTIEVLHQANCPITEIRTCLCSSVDLQKTLATCVLLNCNQQEQRNATLILQDEVCYGIEQESRWPEISRVLIILAALTYPVVILRFISRYLIAHRVWWDDWCILATTVFLIPLTVLPYIHSNQGFGRHFWDIRPERLSSLRKTFYATQMFYVVVLLLSKCSLLFLYLRIFSNKSFQRFVKYCMGFMAFHGLIYLFFLIFQCVPISSIWTLQPAKCVNLKVLIFSGAGLTIFEDFFIMCIPILELKKLSLSTKRKVAIVFMFALGSFATITSIIRLRYIAKFSNSIDVTWDNVDVLIWSDIEMFTSVIFASLICIRPLFSKAIPSRFRNRDAIETNSSPTAKSTSRLSRRLSAVLAYKSHHSRTSGHVKLSEEDGKGSGNEGVDEGRNVSVGDDGKATGDVKVWVTSEASVESNHMELSELRRHRDDLTPNLKAKTVVQGGVPTTKGFPRISEEAEDVERGVRS